MKLLHTLLLYLAVLPQIELSANYYDCRNDKLCFKRSKSNQKAPCSLCQTNSSSIRLECKSKNGNIRNVEGLAPWCDHPRGPFPECPSISSSVLSEGCSDNCQFYNQTFAPGCECTVGCEGERQRTVKCTQELKWNDTNIPDSCPTTADASDPQPSPEHESKEQPPSSPSLGAGPSISSDHSPEQGLPTWSVVLLAVSLLLTLCIVAAVLVKNYLCKRRPNKECSNQPVEDPLLIHPTKPKKRNTSHNTSEDSLLRPAESILSKESKESNSKGDLVLPEVARKVEEEPCKTDIKLLKNASWALEGESAMSERYGYVLNPVVGDGGGRMTQLEPRTLQELHGLEPCYPKEASRVLEGQLAMGDRVGYAKNPVVGNGGCSKLETSTLLEPYRLPPTESQRALSELLQSRPDIVQLNKFLDQEYHVGAATWHNIAMDLLKWSKDDIQNLTYINRHVESPGESFTCKVLEEMEKQGYGLTNLIQYLESRPNRNLGAEHLLNTFYMNYMKQMNHCI